MHATPIPGWRSLVAELMPFYKKNVWYLVGACVLIALFAVIPLAAIVAAFAVGSFALFSANSGGGAVAFQLVLALCGLAAVFWLIFISGVSKIVVVRASFQGNAVPLRQLIRESLDVALALRVVAASLLYGLAILVGLVLFVIPGIYIGVRGVYLSYALVHEKLGVFDSIRRTWDLTRGFWWVTFLRFGWTGAAATAGSALIALVTFAPALRPIGGLIDMAWALLVVSPFAIILSRRMYELTRARKDADAAAVHPLTSSEKWQAVGLIVLFFALGMTQSALRPEDDIDAVRGDVTGVLEDFGSIAD